MQITLKIPQSSILLNRKYLTVILVTLYAELDDLLFPLLRTLSRIADYAGKVEVI